MHTLPSVYPVVHFGAFEVDLSSGEIHKHGHKIKLQEQPFQVLAMLLERPGTVITREDLRTRLWPADTFVDFDTGLNSAIKKLRDALGDSADLPTFIETLPRRGYRFISAVATPSALPTKEPLVAKGEPAAPKREQGKGQGAAPKGRTEGRGFFRPTTIGTLTLVQLLSWLICSIWEGFGKNSSWGPLGQRFSPSPCCRWRISRETRRRNILLTA